MNAPPLIRTALTAVATVLLLAPASLQAQPGPPPPPPPQGGPEGDVPPPELAETIQLFYLHRLRDALDLDEEQTLKILDILDERREAERTLRERHHEALMRLRDLVDQKGTQDSEYLRALEDLERAEKDMQKQTEDFEKREDAVLSPRQRAMRRLFEPAFRRGVEDRIRRLRSMQGGDRPGAGRPMDQRLERLRQTNPELYERLKRRMEEGGPLTDEERRMLMEERRRRLDQDRSGAGAPVP